jgi:hypothetical protein
MGFEDSDAVDDLIADEETYGLENDADDGATLAVAEVGLEDEDDADGVDVESKSLARAREEKIGSLSAIECRSEDGRV